LKWGEGEAAERTISYLIGSHEEVAVYLGGFKSMGWLGQK